MIVALLIFSAVFLLLVARKLQKEEKHNALKARIVGEETYVEKRFSIRLKTLVDYVETLGSQGGMRRTRSEWTLFCIMSLLLGYLVGLSVLGLGYAGAILTMAGGPCLLVLFLKWRKEKHVEQFRYGLQDLTEYGISLFQVAPDMEGLLREIVKNSKSKVLVRECEQILREVDGLGQTALKVMKKRAKASGVSEYLLLVEMTNSAIETNSSLVTIYRDMNATIRRYYGTEKKILAKTSGMRKVGFVLALLPIPTFTLFWSDIKPMLQGGLQIAFYIVIGIVLVGMYVLNRVVKVRV